jgi:tetratricopeptide (TPR) repeat protein
LFFSARLKQGDLLRQMNNFAGAQIIYENLIRLFPEHPRRYVAELSRADCMLALAKNDVAQLKNVAQVLQRLIDLPNLPIDFQAEVGYKWGFALLQHEAFDQAQVVFTLLASRLLLDGENAIRLGVTGRYWMSRTLLELGTRLEAQGQLAEARRVYRKMVAYNLPGRTLAQSRADRLPVVEE